MKLIQLNIEGDKHLERVLPFLARERPDVVTLQEVLQCDIAALTQATGMHASFTPHTHYPSNKRPSEVHKQGIAILTRTTPRTSKAHYYFGNESGNVPVWHTRERDSVWQALLVVHVPIGPHEYTIGTTHFMKSWNGAPDNYQRKRMPLLLAALSAYPTITFAGDFNIPRGTELYDVLSQTYVDHVPREYTTSLDPTFHRVKGLTHLIDYIWSTERYETVDVRMVCGLSDHCALIGHVRHVNATVS